MTQASLTKTKTFDGFDQLSLIAFAADLEAHIVAESPYTDGSLIISLDGKFGSGKTCFFEMFKNKIKEDKRHEVIYMNVWRDDFFDEPVITIASEIIRHINEKEDKKTKVLEATKSALLTVIGTSAVIVNQVVRKTTGIDVEEVCGKLESEQSDKDKVCGNKIFIEYSKKREVFAKLNEALNEYLTPLKGGLLIILVDELDRTRPDYAIKFLETLKHFFYTQGVVFILGVDKDQLGSSARHLYGQDMAVSEYFRKFIHRSVSLPLPDRPALKKYIIKKIEEHFSAKKKHGKMFVTELGENESDRLCSLCYGFGLTPRQIDELFRILSHFFSSNEDKKGLWGWVLGAMVYTVLRINNEEYAKKIRARKLQYADAVSFFNEHQIFKNKHDQKVWEEMLLLLFSDTQSMDENFKSYAERNYPNLNQNSEYDQLKHTVLSEKHNFIGVWGVGDVAIIEIIGKKIDKCQTFMQ